MKLHFDTDELRPLVQRIVAETLAELDRHKAMLGSDRDAYSEAEAADRLGLRQHQLRDERRRGRIKHTRIVGDRVRYTQEHLLAYLRRNES